MRDLLSISEISYLLNTTPAAVLKCIETEGLQDLLIQKNKIKVRDLKCFFEKFKAVHGLKSERWSIPDWLVAAQDAVSKTLVEIYSEETSFPASLPPLQGKQLYDLIVAHAPRRVVEIGCFLGVSSLWIGAALEKNRKGILHSVDLFRPKGPRPPFHWGFLENPKEFVDNKIKKAGLDKRITFFEMKSADFGDAIGKHTNQKIDFLYIDGDHSVGGCLDDFITYYPHVRVGGKILLHDIYPENCGWHGPRYVLDNLCCESSSFEVREIPTEPNYGMALITKLEDNKDYYPRSRFRHELLRQYHRLKTEIGFSNMYQDWIKPTVISYRFKK